MVPKKSLPAGVKWEALGKYCLQIASGTKAKFTKESITLQRYGANIDRAAGRKKALIKPGIQWHQGTEYASTSWVIISLPQALAQWTQTAAGGPKLAALPAPGHHFLLDLDILLENGEILMGDNETPGISKC